MNNNYNMVSTNPFQSAADLSTTDLVVPDTVNAVGNSLISVVSAVSTVIFAIGIVIAIVLFIKAILDRKNIKNELSVFSIAKVKTTSVILLILNILSFGLLNIALSIISLVFANKAKKALESNIELATSKINTASIINIIITALTLVGIIVGFAMLFIGNLATHLVIGL